MKHIFLIDPLEQLTIKKDSSLLLAHTAQACGHDTFLLFSDDLFFSNAKDLIFNCSTFSSSLQQDNFYIGKFIVEGISALKLERGDTLHMRLDPPFNLRYLQTLWLLNGLQERGIHVVNNSRGILSYNEKIFAYSRDGGIDSWVGSSVNHGTTFVTQQISQGEMSFIFKPLDLFQGIGVEKITFSTNDIHLIQKFFIKKAKEFNGPVVIQPFMEEVANGEIRSIFYKGKELGSILKIPPAGEFLANIARGAAYNKIVLDDNIAKKCGDLASELEEKGVSLVAFDVLAGHVSEVNITCPGLLVEVSNAYNKNLAIPFF